MGNVREHTRKLTVVGFMAALTMILVFTPFGVIPNPVGPSLTIGHIPTILTAILFGPFMGAAVGFVFGVSLMLRAIFAPASPISLLFIHPLISILPRVLIGFGAGYGYILMSKLQKDVGIIVGAAFGSMVNTFGVLAMLYVIYRVQVVEMLDALNDVSDVMPWIWGIVTTSGVVEMVTAVVIIYPLAKVAQKARAR